MLVAGEIRYRRHRRCLGTSILVGKVGRQTMTTDEEDTKWRGVQNPSGVLGTVLSEKQKVGWLCQRGGVQINGRVREDCQACEGKMIPGRKMQSAWHQLAEWIHRIGCGGDWLGWRVPRTTGEVGR